MPSFLAPLIHLSSNIEVTISICLLLHIFDSFIFQNQISNVNFKVLNIDSLFAKNTDNIYREAKYIKI